MGRGDSSTSSSASTPLAGSQLLPPHSMPSTSLARSWHWPSAHPKPQPTAYSTSISSSLQLARTSPRLRVRCRAGTSPSVSGSCIGSNKSWASGGAGLHSCTRPATGRRAALAGAARRLRISTVGSADSGSSGPGQPCPLHACLLRHGITDLSAFSAPKHLALDQEAVSSNVEPKLAALAAEGLSPKQTARIFAARGSPLPCSFKGAFLPNLQLLRRVAAYIDHQPHPKAPQLTAAGKILISSPAETVRYLPRDPSKVQQLLDWLEGSLGVGLEQLAACKSLCSALALSASAASAVCLSLQQQQQVPAGQVAHMLLVQPTLFGCKPELLSARIGALQQHLGLDAAAALKVVVAHPMLLTFRLETRLPPLLLFLDGYMGEEGAGRRLVLAKPVLGAATVTIVERTIGSLAARGYDNMEIRMIIGKEPTLLKVNLASPLQQQKLDWIERVSPWTLASFLRSPQYYNATTRRLAARLALFRECTLQLADSPGVLASYSDARFLRHVNAQLARQGRGLPWASWAEWEQEWLDTDEGREWGFPPLTG